MYHRVVMIVSNEFAPDIRVLREAITLSMKFHVFIIAWNRRGKMMERENLKRNIEILRINLKTSHQNFLKFALHLPIFWFFSILTLIKLKPIVIHCHDLDTLPIGIFMKILNPKTKVIFDCHEHYPSMISPYVPKIVEKLTSFLFVCLPLFVDGIVVVNNYLKEYFKKCKYVAVVMNTPSVMVLHKSSAKKKRKDVFRIFYFGGLSSERGIGYLMELAKKMHNVELLIAGDGQARNDVIDHSRKFSNIKYLGWITYDEILNYISISDAIPILYSLISLNNKLATPNKLFLAMAFGKPVIVYKGTLTEYIVKKENVGISVHYHQINELIDAIKLLMNDKILYKALSENGKKAFRTKYNWNTMGRRLLSLYEALLKQKCNERK